MVEVYTSPYEAYDLEIVDDDGRTKGLLEGVRLPSWGQVMTVGHGCGYLAGVLYRHVIGALV